MKIKAQLIQPKVWDTPLTECIVEVEESDSEETIMLKAAHKLMESFEIKIKKVK